MGGFMLLNKRFDIGTKYYLSEGSRISPKP